MESMESPSANTSSFFPFFSSDDLQYICELLSCEASSPHADDPHIQSHTPPPSLPPLHPHPPLSLLSSPVTHTPHFSPPLTSLHSFPSSPLAPSAKRDWISSLSPSFSPSASSPSGPFLAPSPQNLQNCKTLQKLRHHELHLNPGLSHIYTTQTKEASGKQCDRNRTDDPQPKVQASILGAHAYGVALRLSDVNAALQAMPFDDDSQPKVRGSVPGANAYGVTLRLSDVKGALLATHTHFDDDAQPKARGSMLGANTNSVALRLSDVKAALQAMPSDESGALQAMSCDDDIQPIVQGSMLGANAYGVALHLSDVKAALQAMPSDDDSHSKARGSMLGANTHGVALCLSDVKAALQEMPVDSHLSISANASSSHPTSSLNSSTSANPCTWATSGMNQTTNSSLITSCSLGTLAGIPTNVDEWLNESRTSVLHNAESERRESKKNKKTHNLERVHSKVINQDTMNQDTRKAEMEYQELARRKGISIYSERERRQGMKDLYGTLRSLLPDGMTKASRCSVLTGTMEYIQSLLKQLNELGKQKVEVVMLMKDNKKISNIELDGEIDVAKTLYTFTDCNFLDASLAKPVKIGADIRSFVSSCGNREVDHAHAMTKASTSEDLESCAREKGSTEAIKSKKRVEVSIRSENVDSQNPSDENHRVKDDANGSKIYNPNGNGCGDEKMDDVDGCITTSGYESVVGSHGTRAEVGVRFFGENAFINVRTSKRKCSLSSLLEVLQNLGIHILNVTLFSSPDSNHHRIHAKVSSSCKLSSSALQQRLVTFVG